MIDETRLKGEKDSALWVATYLAQTTGEKVTQGNHTHPASQDAPRQYEFVVGEEKHGILSIWSNTTSLGAILDTTYKVVFYQGGRKVFDYEGRAQNGVFPSGVVQPVFMAALSPKFVSQQELEFL